MRHRLSCLWQNGLQRDAVLLLTVQAYYRVSGIILVAVLSRHLLASDIGVYFFALSFAEAFSLLANFRTNAVLLRRIAAAPAHAATYFAAGLGFRLLSSPLYFLCVSVSAMLFTGAIWPIVVVVGLCTLLEHIYFSFSHLFLALRRVAYDAALGIAVQTVFMALFLLGMWWTPSLHVLLGANLLRALCLVGAAIWVTQRWLCPLRFAWDSSLIKEGVPFIALTLLFTLREKLDTLLLGFFTDYTTVGHYQLAFRAVVATMFVPLAIGQAFFAPLAAQGLSVENRRLLVRGAACLFGLGLLVMGVAQLWAEFITRLLYGPQAPEVAMLLRPLTLLFPLCFTQQFLALALQALHYEAKTLWASAIATGVNVLANGVLLPRWGAYGVVYAGLLSNALLLGMLLWHSWRLLQHPILAGESPQARDLTVVPETPAVKLPRFFSYLSKTPLRP